MQLPPSEAARLAGARAAERSFDTLLGRDDSWSVAWWTELLAAGLVEAGLSGSLASQVAEYRPPSRRTGCWILKHSLCSSRCASAATGSGWFRTGTLAGTLASLCDDWGLTDSVDYIGDSAVVGASKPSAAFFYCVQDELGVAPSAAFHVGDMFDYDVVGATAAGVTPVGSLGRPSVRVTRLRPARAAGRGGADRGLR